MAKPGQPTKYRESMCQEVIEFMKQGYSKEAASAHLGISEESFYQYIKQHKEFSEAVKEGTRQSLLFWEKLGIQGASGGEINAPTWIFNMKNRFGWRDKQEISGDPEKPLVPVLNVTISNKP
jgi:hypothetical protein